MSDSFDPKRTCSITGEGKPYANKWQIIFFLTVSAHNKYPQLGCMVRGYFVKALDLLPDLKILF